jgi:hypothetical protein
MTTRVDRPRARLRWWLTAAALVALVAACVWLEYSYRGRLRYEASFAGMMNYQLFQATGPLRHYGMGVVDFGHFDDEVTATVDRVNRLVSPQLRLDTIVWFPIQVVSSVGVPLKVNRVTTCRAPLDDRFVLDSAGRGEIVMCQETLELAFALAWSERTLADAEDRLGRMRRVMDFILAHELAHALLQRLAVPFTGPPEEAADELATLLLVESDRFGSSDVTAVISFLGEISEAQSVPDEIRSAHGMTLQRAERIKCIGIGYEASKVKQVNPNPDSAWLEWNKGQWGATPDQMQRCTSEYGPLRERWKKALKGYWLGRDHGYPSFF